MAGLEQVADTLASAREEGRLSLEEYEHAVPGPPRR
jgi:hypothetical protein